MADKGETRAESDRMKRKKYEKELRKLQVRRCHLQAFFKPAGVRAIIVFEGRDAAGKGGTIKAVSERVSPRVSRRCASGAVRSRKVADVRPALHSAFPPRPVKS